MAEIDPCLKDSITMLSAEKLWMKWRFRGDRALALSGNPATSSLTVGD